MLRSQNRQYRVYISLLTVSYSVYMTTGTSLHTLWAKNSFNNIYPVATKMEKALAIPVDNLRGTLSLKEYLEKIPTTVRMRVKPSLLRDNGLSPIGSHAIIPVRLLSSHARLSTVAVVVDVERFNADDTEFLLSVGSIPADRTQAADKLAGYFQWNGDVIPYCYYSSEGFGYRQVSRTVTKKVSTTYKDVSEQEAHSSYVSVILPENAPGYVEHWITCKRRATNMQYRGEIKGQLFSIKAGLKKLVEHNSGFGVDGYGSHEITDSFLKSNL